MEKGRQKASKIAPKMNQKTYKKHPEKNNQKQIATKDEKYGFWRSRGGGQFFRTVFGGWLRGFG